MKRCERFERPSWYASLEQGPGLEDRFSPEWRRQVLAHAASNRRIAGRRRKSVVVLGGLSVVFALLLVSGALWGYVESMMVRNSMDLDVQGGVVMEGPQVQAFVGGDGAVAGAAAGCWWNFSIPYDELEGNTVSIKATHVESGLSQVELPDTVITEAHRYDEKTTRVSSMFALPIAGKWVFDVMVDGKRLEQVSRSVMEDSWVAEGSFRSGSYEMTGKAGELGFINPGFIAGKTNKYMWHFWGTAKELNGKLEIRAIQRGSDEVINVFSSLLMLNDHNGADASIPTMMMLPERGKWKLIVHVEGRWIGNVIVDVL